MPLSTCNFNTARPGIVIGKKGEDIEKLRKTVADIAE
ncbi:MAG: KH domain-containing protein [Arsenophonus sp. NC-XBC3-MAG3]